MISALRIILSITLAVLLLDTNTVLAEDHDEQKVVQESEAAVNKPEKTLEVVIEGLQDERLLKNVELHLDIRKLPKDKPLPGESRLRWLNARAEKQILKGLEPFGYYKVKVESDLSQTPTGWKALYQIELGPAIPIAKLDIRILGEGSEDPAFEQILAQSTLAEGQPLEHAPYEALKQALQSVTAERGYFESRLAANEIRIDLDTYEAEVKLHLDTGKRYRFGEILFHQDTLDPDFLMRYVDIQPGDFYEASALLELQSDLINSEYFNQVEVNASPDKAEEQTYL